MFIVYQWIHELSALSGIPYPSLIFLVSLFVSFPIGYIFSRWIQNSSTSFLQRHLFMGTIGLVMASFCLGSDLKHILYITAATQLILSFGCHPHMSFLVKKMSIGIIIISNVIYLLYCYIHFQSLQYDVNFLTPLSILCLKYIAISLDLYDGLFHLAHKSDYPHLICEFPGAIEFYSYAFCPFTFLAGPFIPYSKYNAYIISDYTLENKSYYNKQSCVTFLLAMFFLILSQLATLMFPSSFMLTLEFDRMFLIWKCLYGLLAGKAAFIKYYGVWLLVESAGWLSYYVDRSTISDSNPNPSTLLVNVKPFVFESCYNFRNGLTAYNLNTNSWAKSYCFKRFRWIGNKALSQMITLAFLSIWHGFHFGYYICFATEFVILEWESSLIPLLANNYKLIRGLYLHWLLFYFFNCFELLSYKNSMIIMSTVYWLPAWSLGIAYFVTRTLYNQRMKNK